MVMHGFRLGTRADLLRPEYRSPRRSSSSIIGESVAATFRYIVVVADLVAWAAEMSRDVE